MKFQLNLLLDPETHRKQASQAGVRSFIITFDVYVILDIFEKYDNKRPDPICLFVTPYAVFDGSDRCGQPPGARA